MAGAAQAAGRGGRRLRRRCDPLKYAVSMARERGADIDSAGSQFFVVLGDAPWLDGEYTVFGMGRRGAIRSNGSRPSS